MLEKPFPFPIPLDLVRQTMFPTSLAYSPTKLMFETTIHGAKMELTGRVLIQYAQVPGLIKLHAKLLHLFSNEISDGRIILTTYSDINTINVLKYFLSYNYSYDPLSNRFLTHLCLYISLYSLPIYN